MENRNTKPRLLLFTASAIALACPATLSAQTATDAASSEQNATQLAAEALEIQAGATSNSTAFGTLANTVQIETDGDKTDASLSIGYHRTRPIKTERSGGSFDVTTATDSFTVTVSAPLGKGGKPSVFDFDKLGDGTSIEFKGVRYWGTAHFLDNGNPASMQQIENRKVGRCIYGESGKWAEKQGDFAKAQKINTQFRSELATALSANQDQYDPALRLVTASSDAGVKSLATELLSCIGAAEKPTLGSADDYITAADSQAVRNLRGGLSFVGASGTIARTNYEFIVQTPLGKDDVSHTGYKVQAFGGYIFPSGKVSLGGGIAYSRTYKPGDDVQLCAPNGVGAQIACFNGPLGTPAQTNRYTLSGEMRWRLPLPMFSNDAAIGFAPRVGYEFNSHSTQFELPIYFVPEKGKKSLNGGVRFAYNTGSKDFAFGLFVGVPFSIFYN